MAGIPDFLGHFEKADPLIFAVMNDHGPFQLKRERNRFRMLVRSIIGQQLSVRAARTIFSRLEAAIPAVSPEEISRLSTDRMREFGISIKKGEYILDLCAKCTNGTIDLSKLGRHSDDEIIAQLIQVRGIGRWTAQMFLIFALGRLDVFPHEDLGVRATIRRLYGLSEMPSRETTEEVASRWSPYASIASWYCWRSIDSPKS